MNDDQQWDDDQQGQDDENAWDEPADVEPMAVKKKGWSTTTKVIVALAVFGGGFAVICCGGLVYIGMSFQPKTDPQEITALTKEIVEFDIPADFQPVTGIDAQVFGYGMQLALHESPKDRSSLLVMTLMARGQQVDGNAEGEMSRVIQQQLQQQHQQWAKQTLRVEGSDPPRTFEIRGQQVEFSFEKCEDVSTKGKFRRVTGAFKGKNGFTGVMLVINEESYDEEAVIKTIESIK